jgi:hypothetical protein
MEVREGLLEQKLGRSPFENEVVYSGLYSEQRMELSGAIHQAIQRRELRNVDTKWEFDGLSVVINASGKNPTRIAYCTHDYTIVCSDTEQGKIVVDIMADFTPWRK